MSEFEQDESIFDTSPSTNKIEVAEEEGPSQLSPEWHDYVMTKFTSGELIEINGDKYPNCYGLRRVVELLIGKIVDSRPVNMIISPDSTSNNPGRVTVVYEIVVRSHETGETIRYGDIAEVFSINTDDLFMAYPGATAATRAEGRCLRKLLKVRCVAAEELTRNKDVGKAVRDMIKTSPTNGSYQEEDPISGAQTTLLTNKCKEMNIDVLKFINIGEKTYTKLNDVSKKTAINMIKLLNDYQNNSKPIPANILIGA
jgi:hypothetical protein